jgi:hypothetical protein
LRLVLAAARETPIGVIVRERPGKREFGDFSGRLYTQKGAGCFDVVRRIASLLKPEARSAL